MFNYSEIGLKKGNRQYFEDVLFGQLRKVALKHNLNRFKRYRGRYVLFLPADANEEFIAKDFKKIFGLSNVFGGFFTEKDFSKAIKLIPDLLKDCKTFKIAARRADKSFHMNSMQINTEAGAFVLEKLKNIKVDVVHPEITIHFEVYKDGFLILKHLESCFQGLPVGSSGKAVSLFSGGIDSPVAVWMMMKRGCEVIPIHFHTPPYTGEGSLNKVKNLCKVLSEYALKPMELYIVNITELQLAVKRYGKHKMGTILIRRIMGKIASEIAEKEQAGAIITGEALSQVASQTLENIICVNEVFKLPVFRPLIGFDKYEIIEKAKMIGTYDISIQPEIDCCHLFSPSHPETKGKLEKILEEEKKVMIHFDNKLKYEIEKVKIFSDYQMEDEI
jgi:thiamine biosynthesis protein ThiI